MWRLAALIALCFVIAGSISAAVVYAVLDSDKADAPAVEANADAIEATNEKAATAKELAANLKALVGRLRERATTLFDYVRGLKPIKGAPGDNGLPSSIPGKDGRDGIDGTDGADGESIEGPKGDTGDTGATGATGATGPEGPQGPPPTAAEIMAAIADYLASADGREQIRDLINDLTCVAPPPDYIVTCPPPP
jgi:hypothetical protein